MKIHAYQVAPEYQQSPLFYDDYMEMEIESWGIILCGNRDYRRHCPKNLQNVFNEYLDNYMSQSQFCELLRQETGTEYEHHIIRGCCQSDWQYMFAPADMSNESIKEFEAQYFNTGTEWRIEDENEDGEYDGLTIYITDGWDKATYAKEIGGAIGELPEIIEVHEFTGWHKTPTYN